MQISESWKTVGMSKASIKQPDKNENTLEK